jgi:hypothetical protein
MIVEFDKTDMTYHLRLRPECMAEAAALVDMAVNTTVNPLPEIETTFSGGEFDTWITFSRRARPENSVGRRKRS